MLKRYIKNYTFLFAVIAALGFSACEDVIDLELEKQVDKLVVQAWITDQKEDHTVYLSKNATYTSDVATTKETGASVWVESLSEDKKYTFTEEIAGKYVLANEKIGTIGGQYVLHIETEAGDKYISHPAKLLSVAPIDTAYQKYEAGNAFIEGGYDVWLGVQEPEGENYYRWRTILNGELVMDPLELNVTDDRFVDGSRIDSLDVTRRLRFEVGDTVEILQMSLTREAFKFYETVFSQTVRVGGPFDTPPAPIIGNVFKEGDPNDFALGYFGASSVSKARVIIKEDI